MQKCGLGIRPLKRGPLRDVWKASVLFIPCVFQGMLAAKSSLSLNLRLPCVV